MPAVSRCLAPALGLLATIGASDPSREDLSRKNYDDPMDGLWCVGVTASGFEQGASEGRISEQFKAPERDAIKYFHEDEGANCFRVPITWERLQSSLGSTELDAVDGFERTITYITEELGDHAIIVPYEGVGGGLRYNGQNVNMTDFANLWTAMSKKFASNDRVIFELYNYPEYGCHKGNCGSGPGGGFFLYDNDPDGIFVEAWLEWCQAAVDAIRDQGASNYVLVPGYKASSCRDWTGAQFWGETLDGQSNAGNLRMFALNDPVARTAYSVHQYFDGKLQGTAVGCTGHDTYVDSPNGWAADRGLAETIKMAQKYNKKLFLTEVASYPDPDASVEARAVCEEKMGDYLATMAESGVFLGFQVFQFGCSTCGVFGTRDLWTMPQSIYNLAWYDLTMYGPTTTSTTVTTTTKTTSTVTTSTATTTTCTACTSTTTTSTSSATMASSTPEPLSGSSSILPGAGMVAAAGAALAQQLLA